ncbi:cell division control protein 14, SIN component-domain-containing protein [Flammula alnicola]|nr:cell division control protein 14, SIN component-domain-containing protein [Flammula alnicola]
MPLEDAMESMRASLQSSLDEIASPRSSSKSKMKALRIIERNLAMACFNTDNDSEAKDCFLALQYTFECNIPSHLLSWIMTATSRLDSITNRGSMDDDQGSEAEELASQLALSLSLIQGTVLNHGPSKLYLGRKAALETLLDLLLASRHLSVSVDSTEAKSKSASVTPHLTSVVLDTLLCILVDSTAALRAFEEASGVQGVVKILKRAGTPREVRMKCLEFLYFYLLDETPSSTSTLVSTQPTPPSTAPATPIRPPKPYLSATPMHPTSRYGSSTYSFSGSSTASLSVSGSSTSSSSRSTSGSSMKSFSSTSSNASSSSTASSISASPVKESPTALPPSKISKPLAKRVATPSNQQHRTPPNSPPFSSAAKFPQMRSMMMLRKDVDYVPQSPKKLSGLSPRPTHQKSLSTSTSSLSRSPFQSHSRSRSQVTLLGSMDEDGSKMLTEGANVVSPSVQEPLENGADTRESLDRRYKEEGKWKTTEEKKELLGTMLGNVDALVEGVRKAGIWGLG